MSGGINLISSFLYNKSLQLSPLSSSVPYLSFTPVILIGTSFVVLGERPSFLGFWGVICVTAGGYFLHRQDKNQMSLTSQQQYESKKIRNSSLGSLMMLAVAALWSISSTYDKVGVANSTQLVFGAAIQSVVAIGSLVARQITMKQRQNHQRHNKTGILPEVNTNNVTRQNSNDPEATKMCTIFLLLAASHAVVSYYLHLLATAHAKVSYVIALKRAGCIWTVLYGRILFNEMDAHKKLPSILVMVFGVVCIVFKG